MGPGAAILPQDVKKLHMKFNAKMYGGHMGARKFWRIALPRLKYHNPAVSMTTDRSNIENGPATLIVYFGSSSRTTLNDSPPGLHATGATVDITDESAIYDRTETIDMKNIRDSEILAQLMNVTKAIQVLPTPEDKAELQRLHEEEEKSKQDALINQSHLEEKRKGKNLLAMAKGVMTT